jgi:4-amino-4-deoxy-L-arabinose transferase-like glycosyltransferase
VKSVSVKTSVILAALLCLHGVLLAWSAARHSPVAGEVSHLPAGLSHLCLGRFDLYRVNPPLVRTVAAMPVALMCPATNWKRYDISPTVRSDTEVGRDFLAANGSRSLWFFTIARWACIPFSIVGGYACFRWARKLHGMNAGLLAVVLWCFCPYILGHGFLFTPDAHSAAMGIAANYLFWRWLKRPQFAEGLLAGIVLGLAELTKFTLLVFYPLWIVAWLLYKLPEHGIRDAKRWLHEGGMLAAMFCLSAVVVNFGFGFEGSFRRIGEYQFRSELLGGANEAGRATIGNRYSDTWLHAVRMPLPANFVQGIDMQRFDFVRGLPSYLRGQWADHGWWYYYLYALAIKVPLGTWFLVVLAVATTIFGRGYSASRRDEMVVLAPFIVILLLVSCQTGFSVHSRYVIPALPFLFVWISKMGRALEPWDDTIDLTQRRKDAKAGWLFAPWRLGARIRDWFLSRRQPVLAVLVIFALAWSIASSLSIYPRSLSYFNELAAILPTSADASYPKPIGEHDKQQRILSKIKWAISAGPRNGPRHLLDSNIDWGQDLFYLKDWLDEHPNVRLDGVAYWGSYPATLVGISETPKPPIAAQQGDSPIFADQAMGAVRGKSGQPPDDFGPKPGWYALSVNYICGRDRQYRYFLNFEPVAMAGYSIYIYHITLDEANRVRRKLGLP